MRRAVLLLVPLFAIGCDDDPQSPGRGTCTDPNYPSISLAGEVRHRHEWQGFLCQEDRGKAVIIPLEEHIPGYEHTHEFLLTEQEVKDVLDGKYLLKIAPRNLGHVHQVVYDAGSRTFAQSPGDSCTR